MISQSNYYEVPKFMSDSIAFCYRNRTYLSIHCFMDWEAA